MHVPRQQRTLQLWKPCRRLHQSTLLTVLNGDLAALLMADGHHATAADLASATYGQGSSLGVEQVWY